MVKNFPGMSALIEREGLLKAQGATLSLFTCLRLSHNAVGHRRMLKKLAQDCQCSADETFYSPYLSKTLGIGRKQKALRGRTRYNARYNEDNDYNEDNNHKNKKADVRVSYATHTTTPVGPAGAAEIVFRMPKDYLPYLKRISFAPRKTIFRKDAFWNGLGAFKTASRTRRAEPTAQPNSTQQEHFYRKYLQGKNLFRNFAFRNQMRTKNMRQQLTILAITLSMAAQAQKAPVFDTLAKDEIAQNRYLAGSNYLDYDRQLTDKPLTPAPKGYEPYYMSHYGRHGSRWLISDGNYSRPIATLKVARDQGKLTPLGLKTLETLEAIYKTSEKRLGDLTTVGERQHHGIGRRMAQNFPEIFKTPGLKIDARSTTVFRCILSMIAECEELAAANPTAQIHNDVSESLQYYLNQPWEGTVKETGRATGDKEDLEYTLKWTHPERLMKELFNDQDYVYNNVGAGALMRQLFHVACNMQSHDTDLELFSLFTDEEVYDQWRLKNIGWYLDYGASPVSKGKMPFSQLNLLKNIIETADTVTQTQATLRFGHEVCVMPLACLLELDNCGMAVDNLDELDKYWRNYRIFPMACNVQLVFYRPKKGKAGDTLVKALLNEREVYLPIDTDQWPYYKWQDLRKYYLDKIDRFEKEAK